MWVWSLGWEDPLEEDLAIHSSILAWRIPWSEEPGRLQFMGSQRVGHNWSDFPCTVLLDLSPTPPPSHHLSHHRARSLAPWFSRSPGFCKPFYTDPRIASKVELRFILLQFKHSPSTPLARTPQNREWMRRGGVLACSVSISYDVTFLLPCLHWLAGLGQVI